MRAACKQPLARGCPVHAEAKSAGYTDLVARMQARVMDITLYSVQTFSNVVYRVCVGKPEVTLSVLAKINPWRNPHMSSLQNIKGQFVGVL